MSNLQKLYDDIALKFNRISNKRDEVTSRVRQLIADMEQAEADYDVTNMEKLTTQLSGAKRVQERIESDLKKLQAELNGPHETTLSGKIRKAADEDFQAENNSEEVQSKLKEIDELVNKARSIQQELQHNAATKHLERTEETQKFRPFLIGSGRNATLTSLGNYHRVETNEE